jgi:hypothetical protein
MSLLNAPVAMTNSVAVWTGTQMLVYGGLDSGQDPLNVGGAYDPVKDQWTTMSPPPWSHGRTGHTAVWTGQGMLVYGGQNPDSNEVYGDGAIYYP